MRDPVEHKSETIPYSKNHFCQRTDVPVHDDLGVSATSNVIKVCDRAMAQLPVKPHFASGVDIHENLHISLREPLR